jgi:hypothetical protein
MVVGEDWGLLEGLGVLQVEEGGLRDEVQVLVAEGDVALARADEGRGSWLEKSIRGRPFFL